MPEMTEKGQEIRITYRRPSGGTTRHFNLALTYLNGSTATFTLAAERTHHGDWKVLRTSINTEDEKLDADPDDVAEDLAELRWHIFPARECDRILPPVVALWEVGGLIIAACLPDRYGGRRLPLATQERWFSDKTPDPPDPERLICWWPDRSAWEASRRARELLKLVPQVKSISMGFYTFNEWFRRPDVIREMDEGRAILVEFEASPEEVAGVLADARAEEYARYIRRLRTMVLYHRQRGISVRVTMGNVRKAEEYFAERGLDPLDARAWSEAATAFDPMPEVLVERLESCTPAGVAVPWGKAKAAIGAYTHWPGMSHSVDAVGAAIFKGGRDVGNLIAWINPLADPLAVVGKATEILMNELKRMGVQEVVMIDNVLPFEVCPECGGLTLRVPDRWTREPITVQKAGRNDPCPCGSGLKYKKCCGKLH